MKYLIIAIAALISFSAGAQTGVDAMAKQRAKDVANQNNNRGLEQPAPGTPPNRSRPAQAVSAAPLTPSQQTYANFQAQLFAVNTNTAANLKPTLATDMANVAQGTKPSQATLAQLSDHLTAAYAEAHLNNPQRTRLAQNIGVLLNSANTPPTQKEAIIKDVESILKTGGTSDESAAAVATDLKTVSEEIKPAAK